MSKGLRHYVVKWHKKEKYHEPIQRTATIETPGDIKVAANVFISTCGNTNKNVVESIQEYNGGRAVGEPFIPVCIKQNGRYIAI